MPGPGPIFGPQVRGFNYDGKVVTSLAAVNFNAFSTPEYGGRIASGDVDDDGFGELACSPGPSPALLPRVKGFDYDGAAVASLPGFDTTPGATHYGGRVGLGDLPRAGQAALLAGVGPYPAATATSHPYPHTGGALHPLPPLNPFPNLVVYRFLYSK